ncbi:4-hydroxybenzoate octaprenyltransferase [Alteriqipengyuania lutimaris]|uniref:4-hydroxybenzoate octaprenyltransferase n=1 Tax=Alteriqipengyuania lutimaris TaxID=1538146 RepID=A0A395LP03_9SPHN|nr:4-hydroxybenzoate octaprenyltransferase [Alteriqipengyuania lutimaris]MBB3033166.1 4-hydroxybenzoate polyprenyltransferase [Alteriqipengyuania lutimaris]RDS78632.1 4-hydroxybenzoate octaprenyltransferase [Alteriqipengyuania lutimaris]
MSSSSDSADTIVPDSEHRGLIASLPQLPRDLAQLARFDRPIGWWLLFWPCVFGVWLSGSGWQFGLLAWLLLGSIAMRGAGCVYNDITDAELDRKVARTASRPIASGRVSKRTAWIWLAALSLVGLVVLLQLPVRAQIIALASLALVAAYPFMKRITWWPQAWLGLTFNWGVLVGFAALANDRWPVAIAVYLGCVLWTVGYDTIYAVQDTEDDALVGIRSSALRMGGKVRQGVALCYAGAVALWAIGFWLLREDWVAWLTLLPVAAHLAWQVLTLDQGDPANPLERFRSNRWAGFLLALACFVVGNAGV